jgi:hypothetical protein
METPSKTEPIIDKIRRGEVSVFVAVAEEMPEVFRTHVVRKLGLLDTLELAHVNKFYNAAVWSVEAVRSLDEKAKDYAKLHSSDIGLSTASCLFGYKQREGDQGAHKLGCGPRGKVERESFAQPQQHIRTSYSPSHGRELFKF